MLRHSGSGAASRPSQCPGALAFPSVVSPNNQRVPGPASAADVARSMKKPSRRRRPRVLIADDNADERDVYATYFRFLRFDVDTAADGQAAVDHAVATRPDVVVMDLSMPHLDGWEATRRLKADARTADIPVVVC